MSVDLIRELYGYHRWANRRLFDIAADLGAAVVSRDMGTHWSFPTIKGMFAHLYGADLLWLSRWKGAPPGRMQSDADFPAMGDLRARWDRLEVEQRAFVDGLSEADLARPVTYRNTQGDEFQVTLGPLLQHVVNHATHHRSEVATMITLASGSPPDTGIATYRTAVVKG
ncbi:MAG TPA: DinB family protein [Terriglobales bacterium]|nr:DinB family protein [Terriglobales bacterium]